MVGDAVEVRILEIGRNQVKIGVVAPRGVGIFRTEISRMNRQAALSDLKRPEVRDAIAAVRQALRERHRNSENQPLPNSRPPLSR